MSTGQCRQLRRAKERGEGPSMHDLSQFGARPGMDRERSRRDGRGARRRRMVPSLPERDRVRRPSQTSPRRSQSESTPPDPLSMVRRLEESRRRGIFRRVHTRSVVPPGRRRHLHRRRPGRRYGTRRSRKDPSSHRSRTAGDRIRDPTGGELSRHRSRHERKDVLRLRGRTGELDGCGGRRRRRRCRGTGGVRIQSASSSADPDLRRR
mmetsp:Transcript_24856/g.72812  ORF Transcript_24856/g.72812 Transcript_24856/m.72812 type:complete len:208 (+) Transcript_24856:455-1078(+)